MEWVSPPFYTQHKEEYPMSKKQKKEKKHPKKDKTAETPAAPANPEAPSEAKGERKSPPPKRTGKAGIGPVDEELLKLPKQERLPGMEDPAIEEIEEKARSYAHIRDGRMALLKQEVDLKDLLLTLMKRHNKTEYHRDGLTITIVQKAEKVRVKIKDEDEADEESLASA